MQDILPPFLVQILERTPELQRAYLVGGCVRDWLLGEAVVDFDLEVYGVSMETLEHALARWGRTDVVGRSFGIIKLRLPDGSVLDFSLPRRDSKLAPGHKGFEVKTDPNLSLEEASARRDFTLNALLWDPREHRVLDLHGGLDDLRSRRLRHTGAAFVEDPLRVLRGMQFVSRFELTPDPGTVELCRQIVRTHPELAVERVGEEWWKWATRSRKPSAGLRFLEATQWWTHYPELHQLRNVPQDPEWHPEGDVWVHTQHCLDALVQRPEWLSAPAELRGILTLAVLTHDLGKAVSTVQEEREGRPRWISPGHESTGLPLAESLLLRMNVPELRRQRILPLVAQHMFQTKDLSPRAVRRLSNRLTPATIEELAVVMIADASGRPPKPAQVPPGVNALLDQAGTLQIQNQAPKPILLGRHLIQRGMRPGRAMGKLLAAAFEAQLEGEFQTLDEALLWLDKQGDPPG